jgi:hypothetical protein
MYYQYVTHGVDEQHASGGADPRHTGDVVKIGFGGCFNHPNDPTCPGGPRSNRPPQNSQKGQTGHRAKALPGLEPSDPDGRFAGEICTQRGVEAAVSPRTSLRDLALQDSLGGVAGFGHAEVGEAVF